MRKRKAGRITMRPLDSEQRLLHGGDYNPDQWLAYPEILEDDIAFMQKANVNTVTLGVFSWHALEPTEGTYTFEWMDEIFEKVHEFGGKVILATPSGGRPQWLSQKYPEVNRTDEYDRKHTHGFRHNHCYSSPIYRKKIQQINRKLAERYGDHPALLLWHISNEYSGECFCSLCQKNWRKWLKKKYGTLDAINQAWWMDFWGSSYSEWQQVLPPSPLGETKVHGMDLDWKRFVTDQTIDFYLNEIQPIREITPNIPVTTNFMAEGHANQEFIPLEGIDYGKFSKYVDIVSWDSYPDWNNNFEPIAKTAMKSAYVHDQYWSLKKQPFLVMESSPSSVNWHQFNKSKRPGVHTLSSMQQIAHGSDSTLYFQWRQSRGNSEKFHGSVIGVDNSTENRVFKEVSEYGRRLKAISEVKGSSKCAKIGILFDWESNWALKRGGGYGRPTRKYPQTLQEHYSVFWEQDIPVDILTPEQDFSEYSLLIAPMLYLVTEQTMDKLQSYAKAGGTVVSSYFTGMVNETDLLYLNGLPDKLKTLFGLDVLELEMLYEDESNQLLYKENEFEIKDYAAIIKPKTAQVLARYQKEFYKGTPALTKNKFGEGTAYFMAARTTIEFLKSFYLEQIEELSLENDLISEHLPEVSIQMRMNEEKMYYFLLNFSEVSQIIYLQHEIEDLETNELLTGKLALAPYEVRVCMRQKEK